MADISQESFAKEEEGEGKKKKGDAMENGSMQSYRGTATFVIVEAPSKIALTRFSFQFPFPLYPPLKSEGVKKELYNKRKKCTLRILAVQITKCAQ